MDEPVATNGVRARTGAYASASLGLDRLLAAALRPPTLARDDARALAWYLDQRREPSYAPVYGVDATDLAQAGWGAIFADREGAQAIEEALAPLLEHRQAQTNDLYRKFIGDDGVRPGEEKREFFERHRLPTGLADPRKLPYYLLLVGTPAQIPFGFQYLLDVVYAVGRLDFTLPDGSPDLEAYAAYARRVVDIENADAAGEAGADGIVLFSACSADDRATELSNRHLVRPLAHSLSERGLAGIDLLAEADASKAALSRRLHHDPPALLFTAGHGLVYDPGDPAQHQLQGALLCSDWPGPRAWSEAIPEGFRFAGDDLAADADLRGLIALLFACYGAGTPLRDDFSFAEAGAPERIADRAFTARLPQVMLQRGALAVVGHVERAWSYSFLTAWQDRQLEVFESVLRQLLEARAPIGLAMEYFNHRSAALVSELDALREDARFTRPERLDREAIVGLWAAYHDARNYVVLGDPAVRPRRQQAAVPASRARGAA